MIMDQMYPEASTIKNMLIMIKVVIVLIHQFLHFLFGTSEAKSVTTSSSSFFDSLLLCFGFSAVVVFAFRRAMR